MSYVTTLNGLNSTLLPAARRPRAFNLPMPRFAQARAAMPENPPADEAVVEIMSGIGRFTLAMVPFSTLAWVFIAH